MNKGHLPSLPSYISPKKTQSKNRNSFLKVTLQNSFKAYPANNNTVVSHFFPLLLLRATTFHSYFQSLMFSYEPLCFADKCVPCPNGKMCNLLFIQAILFLTMTKYILYVMLYCVTNENIKFELYICILRNLKLALFLI